MSYRKRCNKVWNNVVRKPVLWIFLCVFFCGCQAANHGAENKEKPTPTESEVQATVAPQNTVTVQPEDKITKEPTATLTPTPTLTPTSTPTPTPIPDTTAPEIEGLSDKHIYVGETVSYKKGVTVTDDSGVEPELEIDASDVNLNEAGEYTVIYRATDEAGNTTEKSITIFVKVLDAKEVEVNRLADELIAELITEDMTKWDVCYKLWNWCRTKIKYSSADGDRSTIYAGAYEGLHDRVGDCYSYYATFTVLLEKCGIETIMVTRLGGTSEHFWNLVNLGEGWYHCDASPRNVNYPYQCFMQTDAQIQDYAEWYTRVPEYFTFDKTLYPERETKIIFDGR